ncbi:response regulator transcription factor [bacterium]|nr:response regulator transcription factor [bacterium]MBU1990154.1 response regulator transcription factor [bacterium]
MARILLVEDDPTLSETLKELLEDEGYIVTHAGNANNALEATYKQEFELLLLDVNIPDFNGFDLLDMFRKSGNKAPCIFLTSLSDIASLSRGFEVGGDDYIKKPFDFDELLVRIQAILRKSFASLNNIILYKHLTYKIATNELFDGNKLILFAPQEQKLLLLFFKKINETINKEELLYELDGENESSEGALRVYISKLRKAGLEIQTIKGTGYRLVKA